MKLKIFNTLSKAVEEFVPAEKAQVKLYTCGPTVYDYAHIGNLRSYVCADILKRALEFNGYDVDWVMNITDVDDKTIANTIKNNGATAGIAELESFTQKYFEAFLADLKEINLAEQDLTFIKVTDEIADIQLFIIELIKKGYAYTATDGSTYFNITKYQQDFGDYGSLVGEKFLEGKKIGARVAVDEYEKDNLSDFALWKAHQTDDGEIFWDHPDLGKGRPGWHIECTLINYLKFPTGTDIHTGGIDLVFPHHTNEMAQAQPVYKPFVKYWMHSEHILVDNKKMSKSLGNFYTLQDLKTKNQGSGLELRYLFLQSHYRTRFNINDQSLQAAQTGLNNLRAEIGRLIAEKDKENASAKIQSPSGAKETRATFIEAFTQAINEDLNTPEALAVISKVLKSALNSEQKLDLIFMFDEVLGLNLENTQIAPVEPLTVEAISPEIQALITERAKAKENKDFKQADKIRLRIEASGYKLVDTPEGIVLKKN